MAILKMYKCRECGSEFSDLPPDSLVEIGDINPATGNLENKKPVPQHCPTCEASNVEPIIEGGKHKEAKDL